MEYQFDNLLNYSLASSIEELGLVSNIVLNIVNKPFSSVIVDVEASGRVELISSGSLSLISSAAGRVNDGP